MAGIIIADTPPGALPDTARRLGLIALATDLTIEHDLASLMPERARLHVSRVAFANPTTEENLIAMAPHLAAAANLILPGVSLAAIGFGCTSGSVAMGDDVVARAIGSARTNVPPDVPVVTPAMAAVQGFRALGVTRIGLLSPYLPETTALVAAYFARAGLDVVRIYALGLADDRDIARIAAADILSAAIRTDTPAAEALFVSCTALPVLGLINRIEATIGKPVVSSNQALGWGMLRAAGLKGGGPGRLFQCWESGQ